MVDIAASPTYKLTRMALGYHQDIPITDQDYLDISKSRIILNEIESLEEKFYVICENYTDIENYIHRETLNGMIYQRLDVSSMHVVRATFGRLMLSFSASTRLYRDTSVSHVSTITDSTTQAAVAEKLFSSKYDSSYEYRVMEAIRNLSQHRSFPCHSVSFGGGWNRDRTIMHEDVDFVFQVKKIIPSDKFKSGILAEITKNGGEVDLKKPYGFISQIFATYTHSCATLLNYTR